ncbi:hypothetical protein A0J48_010245 [Sphaerospermopsis aphanizomenoides BCCUSP55]|uniref:hypothetical protein n=1 Tax=Sphaerospermopsis aphanizomenoides TaxID=459663 RepID=UPI0019034608|nr:hypothetical protein [Sphaerospermopsis aphanizomenoides]MBK1987915.1 hypothetical protein [Sphaerospermopsis aphanizomenoides BCCUSP55]
MRIYLYILAGLLSALIGWNIGQFFLTDIGLLKDFPEITLFPCIAISLACGMVMNEIFISNPTRPKLSFRTAKTPLLIAFGLGTLAGLISGGISQILFLPQSPIPPPIIRIIGWLLIGFSVGLAEGLTWRWHSMEAGDSKRFWQRLKVSVFGASTASLISAAIFEIIRTIIGEIPEDLKGFEDPLGFSILGLLLGLTFSITNSPSYLAALRAGTGFEYTGPNYEDIDPNQKTVNKSFPYIDKSILKFVSRDDYEIEEGLSIQLPGTGTVRIGSAANRSHIYIPGLPLHVADLKIANRDATLIPNPVAFSCIEVNGQRLTSRANIRLKHNFVLTFYPIPQDGQKDTKIYRFVYYNRFLDPQA